MFLSPVVKLIPFLLWLRDLTIYSCTSYETAARACEFLGSVPGKRSPDSCSTTDTAESILSLAGIDSFVDTVVSCIRDNGTDTVASHRLNAYHRTCTFFLSLAFNQVIGWIRKMA